MYQPNESNQIYSHVYSTSLAGLFYIAQDSFDDDRGFFSQLQLQELAQLREETFAIKQVNHAHSKQNVMRGIHAEDWNKLVTVTTGIAFCALVDLRSTSPTFKQVETLYLGRGEGALSGALFIPKGIGNSVCVTQGPLDYLYFVDKLYQDRDPKGDVAISMFDPELSIDWPISRQEAIISDRDKNAVRLEEKFK